MNKKVSISYIATKAGVSPATVSRVMNNPDTVSKEKKKKVLRTIKKYDFKPNLLARDFRLTNSKRILVIVSEVSSPIISSLFKGMEDYADQLGYSLFISPTYKDKSKEMNLIKQLENNLFDGVVLFDTSLSKEEIEELNKHYPLIQCSEIVSANVNSVSINDEEAAFDAVNYLISKGHKEIGIIGDFNEFTSKNRKKGYLKALEHNNLTPNTDYIIYSEYNYEGGKKAAEKVLEYKDNITSLFCANDAIALGCVNELKDKKIKIPEDMAVIGFDDTAESLMTSPKISSVKQPNYQIGATTLEILIDMIKGNQTRSKRCYLDHELVLREST